MELPLQSPRPAPLFFEPTSFSQRKKTPFKAPPKAPAKSCPPVSRVFATPHYKNGAHAISFKSDTTNDRKYKSEVNFYLGLVCQLDKHIQIHAFTCDYTSY